MLRSLEVLRDYMIHATDDVLGGVSDLYFDDTAWTVRYLAVDTGTWLPGRKVLIPASSLGKPDAARSQFPVDLTRKQVEDSPGIDVDQPVSRQHEAGQGDRLRSGREITGYAIGALDGDVGHVDDLLVDDDGWRLRYLLVDTVNWLPGRRVVIASDWIRSVDWAERKIHVDLNRGQVKSSPEYDEAEGVTRAYEDDLFAYYERTPRRGA